MSIDVSVIVPTYNSRDALELTLTAFNYQTYPFNKYELIVVDDGSSDDTGSLVDSCKTSYPLRYLRQDNAGRCKARNVGIEMAKGDTLILNDADAIPVPDFIAQHVKSHHSDGSTVVIGGKYDMLTRWENKMYRPHLDALLNTSGHFKEVRENVTRAQEGKSAIPFILKEDIGANFDGVQQYVFRKSYHNWDSVYDVYSETLEDFVIPWVLCVTINVSLPKALMMKAGLFDESFRCWGLEDTEMGYRLYQGGARFVYKEAATNYHQLHPSDYPKRWREHARNYKHFCQKHPTLEVYLHWRLAVGLISPKAYNELVKNFHQICDLGYKEISEDYLAMSKELAEMYGQDEVFLSHFPRPVPESLRISDTPN